MFKFIKKILRIFNIEIFNIKKINQNKIDFANIKKENQIGIIKILNFFCTFLN